MFIDVSIIFFIGLTSDRMDVQAVAQMDGSTCGWADRQVDRGEGGHEDGWAD